MIDLFKTIVEKGEIFGIICVVILIMIAYIINLAKHSKISIDSTTISLLKFLRLFFIVSILLLIFLEVYHNSDNDVFDPEDNPSFKFSPKIAENLFYQLCLEEEVNQKSFNLYSNSKMIFTNDGKFTVINQHESFWLKTISYDTLITTKIRDIETIKFNEYENLILFSFKDIRETHKLEYYSTAFKKIDFIRFVNELNKMGFYIKQDYSKFHTSSIIGIIIIVFAFIVGLISLSAFEMGGCLITTLLLLIGLFCLSYLRSCT